MASIAKMATVATLERMSPQELSSMILATAGQSSDPPFAVVDVRDSDFIGGHIKGCHHVPSNTIDAMIPTLLRRFENKDTVVFHCALSQQRGPSAALKYIRELERTGHCGKQKVMVLDRGFVGWQELFGEEEELTEDYSKELWENGY